MVVKTRETELLPEIPMLAPDELGRSVKIVAEVKPKNLYDDPHAKNGRQELGKPMFNWFFNSPAADPFGRISGPTGTVDSKNVLSNTVRRRPKGEVNPTRVIANPDVMTRHIKEVLKYLGAGQVGVTMVHPSLVYVSGRSDQGVVDTDETDKDDPNEIIRRYPYALCWVLPWDYNLGRAHRHAMGDMAYGWGQQEGAVLAANITGYVQDLGYAAIEGKANTIPLAMKAGIGELGRNGILISEKFGSRVHVNAIFTDMPLVPDKPVDIGIKEFCSICNKCAVNCPTNSIPFAGQEVLNGAEKYKVNWKTCYALRPYMSKFWRLCLTCVSVCPYTKPDVWWRTAAIKVLKYTPAPLRPWLAVRPLKWLDDTIWGKVPRPRVKWLGYDSGRELSESPGACNIAGCSCHSNENLGKEGHYAPATENARRFEKHKEITSKKKA